MNRFLLMGLFIVLMVLSADALRGALFRSGRSLHNQRNVSPAYNTEVIDPSKRSGRVPLYRFLPVVDIDGGDPKTKYSPVLFRL